MNINFEEIQSYYQNKLKEFGGSAQGMDWKNEDTQYLRFEIIARYIDFTQNPTILDVGCGNGEFLNFCKRKELSCKYTGMDIVPEMVALTNQRFGEGTAFEGELLSMQQNAYDYVIASGTFNAKLTTDELAWQPYLYQNIKKMFELGNQATVFNCMTSFVDYRYDRLYYVSPDEIGGFAVQNLSRRFIIDHSYPLYEMTIAIFKNK